MGCQVSYPLNSENASPPGTLRVYLSCAEMATPATKTPTSATLVAISNRFLRFIDASPLFSSLFARIRYIHLAKSRGSSISAAACRPSAQLRDGCGFGLPHHIAVVDPGSRSSGR